MMKSLMLTAPNTLELRERPIPEPGPLDALVKVCYSGVCHTDIQTLIGERADTKYPTVLGHEFSGIVERIGDAVTNVSPGDRVAAMGWVYCGTCRNCRLGRHNGCPNIRAIPFHIEGANQEWVVVPATMLFPISESITMEEAAAIEPAGNAFAVVERANLYPGDHVVVIGAGPIGQMVVKFANFKSPASLTVVEINQARLKMAESMGATHLVDAKSCDPYNAVMDITSGAGADAVLICGGAGEAWELAGKVLANYGRVVLEAAPPTWDSSYSTWIMGLHMHHASYLGMCGNTAAEFRAARDMVQSRKVDVRPLITHRYPLERGAEAIDVSARGADGAIKVMIVVGQS